MTRPDPCGEALIRVCRRRLDESHGRIRACLAHITTEEAWRRPNEHTVSIGNLILHLAGNVRQWIVSGLGETIEDLRSGFDGGFSFAVHHGMIVFGLFKVLSTLADVIEGLERSVKHLSREEDLS